MPLELTLDYTGYPSDESLEKIIEFEGDYGELIQAVKLIWKYADSGYWIEEEIDKCKVFWISTGGWSGNESIIGALERNFVFWSLYWSAVRRGGHYLFIMGENGAYGVAEVLVEVKIARCGLEGALKADANASAPYHGRVE